MNLSNDQKAALYNEGLRRYNLIDEQIREIKSKSFEVSDVDMKKINELEQKKKFIFQSAEGIFSTSNQTDLYFLKYQINQLFLIHGSRLRITNKTYNFLCKSVRYLHP